MEIIDRIRAAIAPKQQLRHDTKNILSKKRRVSRSLRRYSYRVDASMRNWKQAVTIAEDPLRPSRELLYLLYHRTMEDDQLLAQVRTARFNIQMGDFSIMCDGIEQEDITESFDTPWFYNYIQHAVDSELYGYSLVELIPDRNTGLIKEVCVIPREHYKPEHHQLLVRPSDQEGIPYNEGPLAKRVIGIGNTEDLGLLKSISKMVIRKDYNLTDWGRRNERFGSPIIVQKTGSVDKTEWDAKEKNLQNFGSNLYMLMDMDDEFEIKEALSNTGGGHKTFVDYTEYADKCIAIIINGQTTTSEQTAYVGSAEVQERQHNKYTLARMRRIQYHINFELFPWLVKHYDYPLGNCKFQFEDLVKNEEAVTIDVDNVETENEKKKS